ncbi:MAG: hypothetical protein C4538_07205 [Nitrospiraceae bacterium]|nr:MAG: hypothetical protein C4538_07205 [Nitrospiraceae bacterium]
MASLSVQYILHKTDERNTSTSNSPLVYALVSVLSGSINPLLMADTKDADKKSVVFARAAIS